MVSTSDTFTPPIGYGAGSLENEPYSRLPTVQLPAPLGRPTMPGSPMSNMSPSRSSLETYQPGPEGSRSRLVSTPPSAEHSYDEPYEHVQGGQTFMERQVSRVGGGAVLRQSTISSQFPVEQQNPYRFSQAQVATSYDDSVFSGEPEDMPNSAVPFMSQHAQRANRGISLADNGPVPGPEGVRRVARPQGRRASQNPPPSGANRYSRSPTYGNSPSLPPGAAPPNVYQPRG